MGQNMRIGLKYKIKVGQINLVKNCEIKLG